MPTVNPNPDGLNPVDVSSILWYRPSPLSAVRGPTKYSTPPPNLNPNLVSWLPNASPLFLRCRKYAPTPVPTHGCQAPTSPLQLSSARKGPSRRQLLPVSLGS